MADERELQSFAVRTYRYLRLSIVVVVVVLFASVLHERSRVDCWQESISAYYHTPVQAVFVGTLLVVGTSLVVIRGSTDWEDAFLDVAGVLAPVVAFVPTAPPARRCASASVELSDTASASLVQNNVIALSVGGAVVLAIALGAAVRRRPQAQHRRVTPPAAFGLLTGGVLLAGGALWYGAFRSSFLGRAHGAAALAMFLLVFAAIVGNAYSAPPRFRRLYALTAVAMAVGAVGAVVGQVVVGTWRHQILWLELLQLLPFGFFWAVQTVEHWDGGVPTGDERAVRTAGLPIIRRRLATLAAGRTDESPSR